MGIKGWVGGRGFGSGWGSGEFQRGLFVAVRVEEGAGG